MKNFKDVYTEALAKSNRPRIKIDDEMRSKVDAYIGAIIERKKEEKEYQLDGGKLRKRYETGLFGELAVEKLLGMSFVDLTAGATENYRKSDLKDIGYAIGVKTVEHGKFPIIYRNNFGPEIIAVRDGEEIVILGVATRSVLNNMQNDDLVLDPNIKKAKTGFYGLVETVSFKNKSELDLVSECMDLFAA
ncbi:hypothetical protein [Psychrobacillus sp. FSL H8-0510]|uniref:hypothetical protein n=1 Tax=Psychrobacillus sp. FSL H8-0510 TaxID=2921394 RepID=UPI0030FCC889